MRIGRNKLKNTYGINIPVGQYRIKTNPDSYDVYTVKDDTLGCPLLGQVRTGTGVANCKGINDRLLLTIKAALQRGEDVWLVVE